MRHQLLYSKPSLLLGGGPEEQGHIWFSFQSGPAPAPHHLYRHRHLPSHLPISVISTQVQTQIAAMEPGHFQGGTTVLGPWEDMGRVISGLAMRLGADGDLFLTSGLDRRRGEIQRVEAVSLQGCATSFPPALPLGSRRGLVVMSWEDSCMSGRCVQHQSLLEGPSASWLQADKRLGLQKNS